MLAETTWIGHQAANVQRAAASAAPSAKSHEVIDNIAPALPGSANFRQVPRVAAALRDMCFGHFNIAEDCGYDVVKVMSDAARESAHRLHAAGLLQSLLKICLFRCGRLPFRGIDEEIKRHRQYAESPECVTGHG